MIPIVHAPLSATLNKSRSPKENMLTFVFYFIFELKLHQKIRKNRKKCAALNGTRTVYRKRKLQTSEKNIQIKVKKKYIHIDLLLESDNMSFF